MFKYEELICVVSDTLCAKIQEIMTEKGVLVPFSDGKVTVPLERRIKNVGVRRSY